MPSDYISHILIEENIPQYLIMGLDNEIKEFKSVVDNLNLPTADLAACLQQIFDMISLNEGEIDLINRLSTIADSMAGGEGLYENARLDYYEKGLVFSAVMKLGTAILNKINHLDIYIDGYCPYSFYKMLGGSGVILRFHDENFWN